MSEAAPGGGEEVFWGVEAVSAANPFTGVRRKIQVRLHMSLDLALPLGL